MISLEKWIISTPLQKLPNNIGNLGKIIVATGFKWLPKVQKSPNLVTQVAGCNIIHCTSELCILKGDQISTWFNM